MPKAKDIIEDWVGGLTGAVREGIDDTGMDAFGNIFEEKTKATPLDAAQAVADAIRDHTGRRKSVDAWKPVAAKALGFKRLSAKRWAEVLEAGSANKLLKVDSESLSYPVLVALDPEPEPEFDDESVEEPVRGPFQRVVEDDDVPPPYEPPSDWKPPSHLPCGHLNWKSDEANAAAQAEGKCCANKGSYAWHVRGLTHPVPHAHRRSHEKEGMGGWPGLCCHPDTGLYIGGIGNSCVRYHEKKDRCVVHGGKKTKTDG